MAPAAGSPSQPRFGFVGRQPVIDYLTKDYVGFRQGMLDQIPLLLPNWTDRSESDFGVVLIELVAYVADILSYYQDRVANESYLSTATQRRSVTELLRLIGYQIDPGLSASALIHFEMADDRTEVTVSGADLPFKLRTSGRRGEPTVDFEIVTEFTLKGKNDSIDVSSHPALDAGAAEVHLPHSSHGLSVGDEIYFEEAPTSRGGADRSEGGPRSPRLTVVDVTPTADGIDKIRWSPPLPHRFEPTRTTLKGNNVLATHGQTVSDEFIGDGTPSQRFTLSRPSVTHSLRRADDRRRRSSPALEVRVDGALWQEVDSLSLSGPADTHYVTSIDENDYLTIAFGTGTRGLVVPNQKEVQSRYRIGIGAVGNVGAGTLTAPATVPGVTTVTNPFPATGGADRETTEEAKISGPGSVIAQERAVTLEDYRLLAQAFPGVAKANARVGLRGGYKVVHVFVAPEHASSEPPSQPSSGLKAALKHHLEARMPVNRMAGVDVLDAVYVLVDVTVDVHLRPEAKRLRVGELADRTLSDLLAFGRQDFGHPVRVGEIFSALFPLEGVAFVQLKRLARRGSPAPASECELSDVAIGVGELAVKGDVTVNLIGGQG
jgi:hypothetical protein